MSVSRWVHFIQKNRYVQECLLNQKKDTSSLSSLVDFPMSQSDCIKLGTGFEKVLRDIILSYNMLSNLKGKNMKGVREKDHLFCDDSAKVIYFAELKGNINLDTEKSHSTCQKCLDIVNELSDTHQGYTIEWCLVACRYTTLSEISRTLCQKYQSIHPHLMGVNEYLALLKIPEEFSQDDLKQFVNDLATEMFTLKKNS